MMDVTFADDDLDRLETDASFDLNLPEAIVKAYRKRIQAIGSLLTWEIAWW